MAMNTIDDLFAYRDKIDRYIQKKIGDRKEEEALYLSLWEEVAPQLLDIASCVFEWATIKVKFGIDKNLEITFNGVPGGGCKLALDSSHSLYLHNDTIQFVESDALRKYKQETVFSETDGVCDISFMFDNNVCMIRYLLNNWTELRPLILKNIANNLRVWAESL